jgi:heterodisulfide reductase subunit B
VLYITQLIGLALGIGAAKLGLNTNIVSPRKVLDLVYNPVNTGMAQPVAEKK